jgi:hypothetical protein
MKTSPEQDLMFDLARLLRKHGPATFDALAATISSPEARARLTSLLRQSAEIARRSGVTAPVAKLSEVERILERLKKDEPEKFELLHRFADDLLSRKRPVSNSELAEAARELGGRAWSRDSRCKITASLIERLAELSFEAIQQHLHRFRQSEDADRSLAAWAGLIMRDAPK